MPGNANYFTDWTLLQSYWSSALIDIYGRLTLQTNITKSIMLLLGQAICYFWEEQTSIDFVEARMSSD